MKSGLLPKRKFQTVLDALKASGYAIKGPSEKEGAIQYDDIEWVEDLPLGVLDEQRPG